MTLIRSRHPVASSIAAGTLPMAKEKSSVIPAHELAKHNLLEQLASAHDVATFRQLAALNAFKPPLLSRSHPG